MLGAVYALLWSQELVTHFHRERRALGGGPPCSDRILLELFRDPHHEFQSHSHQLLFLKDVKAVYIVT